MDSIYILRTFGKDRTLIKLGYSSTLKSRLTKYKDHNPLVEVLYTFDLEDAQNFEKIFHKHHKADYKNEWYNEILLDIMLQSIKDFKEGKFLNDDISNITLTQNFKETVLKTKDKNSDFIMWAYKQYSFLHDAITYLGYEKIEELEYNITNIKRYINKAKFSDKDSIIKAELKQHFKITNGAWISKKEIKDIFRITYNNLEYNITPKAIDILKYWDCRTLDKKINGASISGYELIKELK